MDVAEAMECAEIIGAKRNIPYHMTGSVSVLFKSEVAESFDEFLDRLIVEAGEEIVLKKGG